MNNFRRTPVSIPTTSVIMLPHMRIRTVVKAVLWIVAIAVAALLALVVWEIFPGTPGIAKSLKFEGFVLLPKDSRARVLTVMDYLTLYGNDLFVTKDRKSVV